jgi:hypothetical protein
VSIGSTAGDYRIYVLTLEAITKLNATLGSISNRTTMQTWAINGVPLDSDIFYTATADAYAVRLSQGIFSTHIGLQYFEVFIKTPEAGMNGAFTLHSSSGDSQFRSKLTGSVEEAV